MPRHFRVKSGTDTYHIMIRGINKEEIFKDISDRRKFLKTLKNTKEKYQYYIYAYCLMNNHVHLLINDSQKNISNILQSLLITYAIYFNKKYDRVGHVFQNRYNSKCVENLEYLLNVVRYIHRNPENANIEKTEKYEWSSYKEYIYSSSLVDTEYVLNFFDNDIIDSKKKFKEFNLAYMKNYQDDLEYEFITNFSDEEAERIIYDIIKLENLNEISNYNIKIRNQLIKKLKEIRGISKAQLSRILKIDRKIIERA